MPVFCVVTGKTLAENAKLFPSLSEGQVNSCQQKIMSICGKDVLLLSVGFVRSKIKAIFLFTANYKTIGKPHQTNWSHPNIIWEYCT